MSKTKKVLKKEKYERAEKERKQKKEGTLPVAPPFFDVFEIEFAEHALDRLYSRPNPLTGEIVILNVPKQKIIDMIMDKKDSITEIYKNKRLLVGQPGYDNVTDFMIWNKNTYKFVIGVMTENNKVVPEKGKIRVGKFIVKTYWDSKAMASTNPDYMPKHKLHRFVPYQNTTELPTLVESRRSKNLMNLDMFFMLESMNMYGLSVEGNCIVLETDI